MTCKSDSTACTVAEMRHRLVIQNVVKTPDGQGGFTEAWVDGTTISASIVPMSSFEKFQAMQMQSPQTHKIGARYTSEVTNASRLKFGERIFWVKDTVNVEERGRFLLIKAIERVTS